MDKLNGDAVEQSRSKGGKLQWDVLTSRVFISHISVCDRRRPSMVERSHCNLSPCYIRTYSTWLLNNIHVQDTSKTFWVCMYVVSWASVQAAACSDVMWATRFLRSTTGPSTLVDILYRIEEQLSELMLTLIFPFILPKRSHVTAESHHLLWSWYYLNDITIMAFKYLCTF